MAQQMLDMNNFTLGDSVLLGAESQFELDENTVLRVVDFEGQFRIDIRR